MNTSSKLKLRIYPDPILRNPNKDVEEFNNENLDNIIEQMIFIMKESNGVGLAGPQVGINKKLFVMRIITNPEEHDEQEVANKSFKEQIVVMCNPKILEKEGKVKAEEGCLSFPEIFGTVERYKKIRIEAQDSNGKKFEMTLEDYPSRVFQHEFDHLLGILFYTKFSNADRIVANNLLKELEEKFKTENE